MLLETLFGRNKASDDYTNEDAEQWFSGSRFIRFQKTKSGVRVSEDVAFAYSAVWCATLRRCGVLGSLPKNLYRRGINSKTGLREKLIQYDHPIQKILHDQANPEMTAFAYHSYVEEKRLNAGNGYAEIEWELVGGVKTPRWLWPIHPSRVTPKRHSDDGRIVYEIRNPDNTTGYIEAWDMIHLPSLMMRTTLEGMGAIEFGRESIGFGLATERHGAKMMGSGTMPKAVLTTTTTKMNVDQRKDWRKEWREIHEEDGFDIAILGIGEEIKPLTLSLRDQMYLETRQHNIEEMSRLYDLPPHSLHHLLRATNNNIEEMSIGLVVYSFVPWIVPNEQHYLYRLMPDEKERANHYIKYEVNGLLRGNSAARAAFYHQGITDGWLCPNDATELEDFNPFPGGDQHFIQGAMAPILEDGTLGLPMSGVTNQDATNLPPETVAPVPTSTSTEPIVVIAPVDQPNVGTSTSRLKSVAKLVLQDCLQRMIHKEATAARRASKNPSGWLAWLDEFYTSHADTMGAALVLPFEAAAEFGVPNEPATYGREFAEGSKRRLLELSGEVAPGEFANAVDSLMNDWERSRAASTVMAIEELN